MFHFAKKISGLFFISHSLGFGPCVRLLASRLFSINHYYILGRSLDVPLDISIARQPPGVLSLTTPADIAALKSRLPSIDAEARKELISRLLFYESGFPHCYCMKHNGEVAYLQWLIFPSENGILHSHYATKMLPLADRQVMVENAFALPRFRGRGYLPHVTMQLLGTAKAQGYTSAVCYIRTDRLGALNEFVKMGFRITKLIREYKIFGFVWRTL